MTAPGLPSAQHALPEVSSDGLVARFDDLTERAAERLRGHQTADRAFYALSELADWSLLWHIVGTARAAAPGGDPAEAIRLSALLGAESLIVNGGVKSLFRRERPVFDGERPHKLRQPVTSSFPSGHASAAFTAAMIVSQTSRRRWPWFALASLVAWSRVHVKIHHGSDVVGGAVIGIALGATMRRLWPLARGAGSVPRG